MSFSPKISVITANYNGGSSLEQSIKSVINQTYKNIEYIIIDGGSTDESTNLLEKYSSSISFSISEKDDGIYDAWNKGIKASSGDWILFLGSDDFLYNTKTISNVVTELEVIPVSIDLIYGKVEQRDPDNGEVLYSFGTSWADTIETMNSFMSLPHPGLFYNSKLFKSFGVFDTHYKIVADYHFCLKLITKNNIRGYFMNRIVITLMSQGGVSSSFSNNRLMFKEISKVKKDLGINSSSFAETFLRTRFLFQEILFKISGPSGYTKFKKFANRFILFNVIDGRIVFRFKNK